jgi:AcrR family transcriptional regulator
MPRKTGSKNADFAASRAAILVRLRDALLKDNPPSSYRGLATAAGVTIPTLQHYFGNREEVFAAIFVDFREGAEGELAIAETPTGLLRQSTHDLVMHVADGFRYGGLVRLHAVGLAQGLSHIVLANSYLNHILEPTILATERRLDVHIAQGEMHPANTRYAAISLLSPIVLIFLHQQALDGAVAYPTDIDSFLQSHINAFVGFYEIETTIESSTKAK